MCRLRLIAGVYNITAPEVITFDAVIKHIIIINKLQSSGEINIRWKLNINQSSWNVLTFTEILKYNNAKINHGILRNTS